MRSIRKNSERGNALLEFAVGWTVLWFLFAGVYQFGYAFYVYNVMLTAVAHAAELGSKITYDTSTPGPSPAKGACGLTVRRQPWSMSLIARGW